MLIRAIVFVVIVALIVRAVFAQDAPTPVPTAGAILNPADLPIVSTVVPTEIAVTPTALPFDPSTCAITLEALYVSATEACVNKPSGFACNAGAPPAALPEAVAGSFGTLGSLVEAGAFDVIRTQPVAVENNSAGIVYVRPETLLYSAILMGDARITDISPPEFPAWTSFVLESSPAVPACPAAPLALLILQSTIPVRIVVNGASLLLDGTVIVRADPSASGTRFVAMAGQNAVTSFGVQQPLVGGEAITVPFASGDVRTPSGEPSAPRPFDPAEIATIPIGLIDRPFVLPQPGYVITQGATNLRTEPTTNGAVIVQVLPGEILGVLGRVSGGSWVHVRRNTGETGWMLTELLAQNLTTISAEYDSTPLPPQRYGDLGTRARVSAPGGISLRTGPDPIFPSIIALDDGQPVTLIARSPYSPWVKVDAGGAIGWVALITLETAAYIDALEVDYQVPLIPTPTIPPGSFGNAFPDPLLPGN